MAVITEHNGVEGDIGEWLLVLTPVEELVEQNTNPVMEFFPGLVMIGGDGGGEALAIDRGTREILMVPWIGGEEDWLVLGATLTEAFQRMERGEMFDAPVDHDDAPEAADALIAAAALVTRRALITENWRDFHFIDDLSFVDIRKINTGDLPVLASRSLQTGGPVAGAGCCRKLIRSRATT